MGNLVLFSVVSVLMFCGLNHDSSSEVSTGKSILIQAGHVAPVCRLRCSPDGRYLLTHSILNDDILWDAKSGVQLRVLRESGHLYDKDWPCDMSPDGKMLLVGRLDNAGNREILLQAVDTGKTLHVLKLEKETTDLWSANFSCDGRYVVSLHSPKRHYVWEAATGKCIYSPSMPLPYRDEMWKQQQKNLEKALYYDCVDLSKDCETLFFLKNVRPDGKPLYIQGPVVTGNIARMSFLPNNDLMITRDCENSESCQEIEFFWDVSKGTPVDYVPIPNLYPHSVALDTVNYSSDSKRCLSGIGFKNVWLLESKTRKTISRFEGHQLEIMRLAFSPDGKTILSGDKAGIVILWNVKSGKKLTTIGKNIDTQTLNTCRPVVSLAYSPDAKYFLVGYGDAPFFNAHGVGQKGIEVYSTTSGKKQFDVLGETKGWFSPDGSRIFTESAIRDTKTGECLCLLASTSRHRIEMSPDENWAISPELNASFHTPGLPAKVWNTTTGTAAFSFVFPKDYSFFDHHIDKKQRPSSITPKNANLFTYRFFKPNETFLRLAWAADDAIGKNEAIDATGKPWLTRLVDRETPRKIQDTNSHEYHISETGRLVASIGSATRYYKNQLYLSNIEGVLLHTLESDGIPTAITFSQDDAKLLVAYKDDARQRWLILWDTKTGKKIQTIAAPLSEHDWEIRSMTLSPNEHYLALGVETGYQILLLDLKTGTNFSLKPERGENYSDIPAIFSPDNKRVYCFGYRHTLWDIKTKKLLADFGAYNGVSSPIFSPNGKYLIVQSNKHGTAIWNAETGSKIQALGEQYGCFPIFSPDGTRLVPLRWNSGPFELWDFQAGKMVCKLALDSAAGGPYDAIFTPDGKRLVTTYGTGLATWDAQSGKRLTSFIDKNLAFDFRENQQLPFFTPDAKRFVTVQKNGAVVWDLDTGKPIHRFTNPTTLRKHALLSHDGQKLFVISGGHDATLWNTVTGKPIQTFSSIPFDVEKVWFSKNDTKILVRHREGKAVIAWDVTSGKVVTRYYLLDNGQKWLTFYPQTGKAVGATEFVRQVH